MPILSVKDLRQAPGYLFRRAFQLSVAIATEQLATHNLTTVQFASLVGIHEHPGLDATRLSALIKFDKATLTGEIDRLEAKALIERRPHPSDRRARTLHLTREGEKVLREASVAARETREAVLEPLPRAERKQLLTLLNKLIELHADREHIEAQDPEQKVTPP
ncbi:MAG: MarR family transcriptional regulator [Burkholderiaceae bacterium]|jgi:DNA-binding MarR family transcriptional regulator|uniref:MarR family winged helix-turn-helix transcriptional regulator n=1 Tax=Candidatus Skiveiella danica TaxID=3386177 RepID=UPI001B55BA7B|nr:MarR family transcriptional regulator [Betaproteobacteria bacterium]MBP6307954.1 MarR family transcriptional regulator [Burkholderiaceae bacterium]MBP9784327.1 MarR family transcriptional regulator [Giesbergeria sp.]MDO8323220.1 MarR family transcriptional regulator [Phenylobacterium sp.]HNZ91329.1 MarR family transcriptional regulator [Acidovorax sp.]HQD15206.1 MarR family transcriptional regulator [Ottowia sp.]